MWTTIGANQGSIDLFIAANSRQRNEILMWYILFYVIRPEVKGSEFTAKLEFKVSKWIIIWLFIKNVVFSTT